MKNETLMLLEADFEKHPVLIAGPVPRQEVLDLEKAVGFTLPADYKIFVERFGGAIVGPYSVFGLRSSEAMASNENSAMEVTKQYRQQAWPGTENWLVVSIDHAGNPFGLDQHGQIFISDHDAVVIEIVANSFEDFLYNRCLLLNKPKQAGNT